MSIAKSRPKIIILCEDKNMKQINETDSFIIISKDVAMLREDPHLLEDCLLNIKNQKRAR